ncbi:MAG: cytidine deaminase [Candidatus Anoxymicrobium japonicum]|uniref:Cytidine deaminase n=1 Tax=Candidatus Anoxymicrobium japonicum TaxID=2013648 RepID=A0A2N3G4B3_9ACTN|nr:MAG: cytidine deaminase [Candidatus Anoxymicrobium japonicum]
MTQADERPSYDEYFIEMAHVVAKRSTCLRRKVGALFVKNNHILCTGYNGAPKHIRHCSDTGCLRAKLDVPSGTRHELCRGLHAEQNGILQAALFGISLRGSTLYCTNVPCVVCAKMLINAGVNEVIYEGDYADDLGKIMLYESGISAFRWKNGKREPVRFDADSIDPSLSDFVPLEKRGL